MAKPLPNEFQTYEFESDKEERQASVLTEGNIQAIQNKRALAMIERSRLTYDPEKPITVFVQREAALMGEIAAYDNIIDSHNAVIEHLNSFNAEAGNQPQE